MNKEMFAEYAVKSSLETTLQEALDILDANDRKTFDQKKEAVINHLRNCKEPEPFDAPADRSVADKMGQQIKNEFWRRGNIACPECDIILRKVEDADREGYLELQREYSIMKSMLKEPVYCDMAWNEHVEPKALMLSIIENGNYIGYCGIKSTVQNPWEIAIEILPDWTKNGIGYMAVTAMLEAIKARLGVVAFRVRIDPGNQASQKLFEKLGAVPNGISEFLMHDENALEKFEEDNLHLIDEHLIALADKFNVKPRKLLSHVLEYTLFW